LPKVNESAFDVTLQRSTSSEKLLFSRRQQPDPHGNADERIANAREAAEALFTAKPPVASPADEPVRKPRVLAIVPSVPAHHAPTPAAADRPVRKPRVHASGPRGPARRVSSRASSRMPRRIPPAQHARICTWVEYGMTAAEVAEVYGTPVGEIERILRKAQA
jgi:hypothetical protein